MERRNAAPGLIDGITADLGGPRTTALLGRLEEAVPWTELAKPVQKLYSKKRGRPAWPAVMMLKCMMLAKWFGLSDPQLEECLQDRLSFRRFVGLSLTDRTPDETTFVVFRRRLREADLHDVLFDKIVEHFANQGLLIRDGTLVDATIIEAPRCGVRKDGTKSHDPEASYTKKRGELHFGYKGHIASDRSGIVMKYRFSTAKVHDAHFIDEMTVDETCAVIADSAYMNKTRSAALENRGVKALIAKRRTSKRPFTEDEIRWNSMVAKVRAYVEHPFAIMKQQLGYRRTRYRGLERNRFDFCVNLMATNIKRSLSLKPVQT